MTEPTEPTSIVLMSNCVSSKTGFVGLRGSLVGAKVGNLVGMGLVGNLVGLGVGVLVG